MQRDFMQGVEFSHFLLKKYLAPGDFAVDATCGNGYDSVFLAELVGESGFVWSFDIQKEAIGRTQARLKSGALQDRVRVINDGHQNIKKYLQEEIAGIIFNLGYLPGADKKIITTAKNTLKAVRDGLSLLQTGGLMVLVIYTGHPGGAQEKNKLLAFCSRLEDHLFNVLHYHFINQHNSPAEVLAILKRE